MLNSQQLKSCTLHTLGNATRNFRPETATFGRWHATFDATRTALECISMQFDMQHSMQPPCNTYATFATKLGHKIEEGL